MSVDGVDDMLVIEHTEALYLGKDGADFTVSFGLLQTQDQGDWRNLIHKGNGDGERTPAIWKHHANRGLHARISTESGGNQGIDNSAAMELNQWVYITYVNNG
jgi:hypothetical protein